jgi:hypothetical protein
MPTPTAVSPGRLARCLSLRSLAGLGRLVALLLGEAAPDAVDLPGPATRTRASGPDRAARRSPSPRPPAPATCPWTRSGRTDRDRRTGRRQAATTCRRQSAAPPRRGTGTAGRLPRHGASGEVTPYAHHGQLEKSMHWPRCGRRCTSTSASRCGRPGRPAQALSPARVAAQSWAMAKAGRNQHMHGCPRKIGSAVLRSRESP